MSAVFIHRFHRAPAAGAKPRPPRALPPDPAGEYSPAPGIHQARAATIAGQARARLREIRFRLVAITRRLQAADRGADAISAPLMPAVDAALAGVNGELRRIRGQALRLAESLDIALNDSAAIAARVCGGKGGRP